MGRREEALATATEAVTLRRGLAETNPGAFLPDLLRSLATLVAVLRELNRPDGADATYLDVGTDLPPWAQARLLAARAPTRATKAGWADLVAAANLADTDPDTSIAAPARRTIRATAQNLASDHAIETAPPSETGGEADNAPSWLLRPYPENLAALLNIWITAESVVDQTAALETLVSTTSHPDGAADLAVLMALHADTSGVEDLPNVLEAARTDGVATVAQGRHHAEQRSADLTAWLETPTWTDSRAFLDTHPGFLTDPLVEAMLDSGSDDPLIAQHLGIARLATRLPLAEIYDLITDPADATDTALDAVEQGDADLVRDLILAAPDLLQVWFLAPYLAGAVALLDGDPDTAADLMTVAAEHATQTGDTDTPATAAARLRRLNRRRPDLTQPINQLTKLLIPAPDNNGSTPGTS